MYGRKMQRKINHRRPITFRGFQINRKVDVHAKEYGETQQDCVNRLRETHGQNIRLTPRY